MENAYGKFILLMKSVVNIQSQGAMKTERVVCTAERLRTCGARCGEHNQACFEGHPCREQSRSLSGNPHLKLSPEKQREWKPPDRLGREAFLVKGQTVNTYAFVVVVLLVVCLVWFLLF